MNEEQERFLDFWNKDVREFSKYLEKAKNLKNAMHWIKNEVTSQPSHEEQYKKIFHLCSAINLLWITGDSRHIPRELMALREFMLSWKVYYTIGVPFERWFSVLHTGLKIALDGIKNEFKSIGDYQLHPDDNLFSEYFTKTSRELEVEYPVLQDPMGL